MIDLIDTLMHQQNGLVVWPKQTSSKRSLPKRHCSPLNPQTTLDALVYLRLGDWCSLGEEMRSDLAGRRRGKCCLGCHGSCSIGGGLQDMMVSWRVMIAIGF